MHYRDIKNSLITLKPITLEDIECVRLMNRIDTKYILSSNRICDLLALVNGPYKVLEIGKLRAFPYYTSYYDTSDYFFYNQHIRGEVSRHKVRFRKYESTGTTFFEIKRKTNKNRTIKWRIVNSLQSGLFDESALDLMSARLPISSSLLKPVLIISFTRITLAGIESLERITIDYDISYSEPSGEKQFKMPYLAIVELKKERLSNRSQFNNLMKQLNLYPGRFSKYCMGIAMFNESVKKNTIKPDLLLLKKIENEYIIPLSGR